MTVVGRFMAVAACLLSAEFMGERALIDHGWFFYADCAAVVSWLSSIVYFAFRRFP